MSNREARIATGDVQEPSETARRHLQDAEVADGLRRLVAKKRAAHAVLFLLSANVDYFSYNECLAVCLKH